MILAFCGRSVIISLYKYLLMRCLKFRYIYIIKSKINFQLISSLKEINVILSVIFLLSVTISLILIIVNSLLGEKRYFSREIVSAFECGFDPKSPSRLPFSLHFFLIALIFLIFDVEITLLIPLPITYYMSINASIETITSFFVLILILGVIIEWGKGALEWNT